MTDHTNDELDNIQQRIFEIAQSSMNFSTTLDALLEKHHAQINIINAFPVTKKRWDSLKKQFDLIKQEAISHTLSTITEKKGIDINEETLHTTLKSETSRLFKKKLTPLLDKAMHLNDIDNMLKAKQAALQSPLLLSTTAKKMIPHIAIKQLYESRRVRGFKYKGNWYYAKRDIEKIADEERYYIKRIDKLLFEQKQKLSIKLYRLIVKIEKTRGIISKSESPKNMRRAVKMLDELIIETHKFRDNIID